VTPALLVLSLAVPFATMAQGASAQPTDAIDPAPTAIERALTERACMIPSLATADADARQRCVDAQLGLLRADFGVNLKRISASERNALDTTCRRLETTHGRDGYLDCVNAQLIALRARHAGAAQTPARTSTAASDAQSAAVAATPTPASATTAASGTAAVDTPVAAPPWAPAASFTATRNIQAAGAVLLLVATVTAGSILAIKRRRIRRVCRDCGGPIGESGDLCASCRHTAADAMRRAATERMEQVRAEEAERRHKQQAEEEQRRQHALVEEELRARDAQDTIEREDEMRRRREEDRRRQSLVASKPPAAETEDGFDPYAVLGVAHDTTPEDLRSAYEQARTKYDQDTVAHLGVDVQEHFREKALAVDRAYHMLAG